MKLYATKDYYTLDIVIIAAIVVGKRAGINTVEELTNRTAEDMMKVRNLGRKSLEEVLGKLKELGLELSSAD